MKKDEKSKKEESQDKKHTISKKVEHKKDVHKVSYKDTISHKRNTKKVHKKEHNKAHEKKEHITEHKEKVQIHNEIKVQVNNEVKAKKSDSILNQKIPAYFIILALAFILVAGGLVYQVYFPEQKIKDPANFITPNIIEPPPSSINTPTPDPLTLEPEKKFKPIEIIVLESIAFNKMGYPKNSLLGVFENWGIDYNVTNYNIDTTQEGKILKEKYEVFMLSTILVNANDLNKTRGLSENWDKVLDLIDKSFYLQDGYYVVSESNVDNKPHRKLFLEQSEICKIDETKKYTLKIFFDPYNYFSLSETENINDGKDLLKDDVSYEYLYFITQGTESLYEENDPHLVRLAGYYHLAAQDQNKFREFQGCFEDLYCDNEDDGKADVFEKIKCQEKSNRFGTIVTEEELVTCANQVGLDLNKVNDFLENKVDAKMQRSAAFQDFYLLRYVPISVLNCNMTAYAGFSMDLICKLDRNLKGCLPERT